MVSVTCQTGTGRRALVCRHGRSVHHPPRSAGCRPVWRVCKSAWGSQAFSWRGPVFEFWLGNTLRHHSWDYIIIAVEYLVELTNRARNDTRRSGKKYAGRCCIKRFYLCSEVDKNCKLINMKVRHPLLCTTNVHCVQGIYCVWNVSKHRRGMRAHAQFIIRLRMFQCLYCNVTMLWSANRLKMLHINLRVNLLSISIQNVKSPSPVFGYLSSLIGKLNILDAKYLRSWTFTVRGEGKWKR